MPSLDDALTSPGLFQDPWPVYARLRTEAPVYWCEPWQQWLVTRHEDVSFILRHPEVFSSRGWEARYLGLLPQGAAEELPEVHRHYGTSVVSNSDPPQHTRLRRLLQRSFNPRVVQALEQPVTDLVATMLEALPTGRPVDWVTEFAYPLPATVIAMLFGAPVEDRHRFEKWSADITAFVGSGAPRMDLARAEESSLREFRAYLGELIELRRREPAEDLLSGLVSATDEEEALSEDELVSTCITLLFAGHETTANLLSSLLLQLLRDAEHWRSVVAEPALVPRAVEETLRLDGPVQRVRRVAREDLELGGELIRQGDLVMGFIGSANRDESVFPQAATFDLTRSTSGLTAFGGGVHACMGAILSRLEARIVLEQVTARYPRTELAPGSTPTYRPNMTFRGLESLPLVLAS